MLATDIHGQWPNGYLYVIMQQNLSHIVTTLIAQIYVWPSIPVVHFRWRSLNVSACFVGDLCRDIPILTNNPGNPGETALKTPKSEKQSQPYYS